MVKRNWKQNFRVEKNFYGRKNFRVKKIKKRFGSKKFWVKNFFGSKKFFGHTGPKKIWEKIFWVKKILGQKNLDVKKFLVKKIFFGLTKFFSQKKF